MEQKVDPTVISAELWATGLVNNPIFFVKIINFPGGQNHGGCCSLLLVPATKIRVSLEPLRGFLS